MTKSDAGHAGQNPMDLEMPDGQESRLEAINESLIVNKFWAVGLPVLGACLLWLSQPPLALGGLAWIALVPWILWANRQPHGRLDRWAMFTAAMAYWLVTMQGLRHAHPAMYAAWIAFAFYLSLYGCVFVWLTRVSSGRWWLIPIIGTGLECVRNYLLTGVSACMIGHTQANFLPMIQIADAFGSYGISFLIYLVNAAIAESLLRARGARKPKGILCSRADSARVRWIWTFAPICVSATLVACNLAYGAWRLNQSERLTTDGDSKWTACLVGRDEEIVFIQDQRRELEIFNEYFQGSLRGAELARQRGLELDAVIWPESMYTGALPWIIDESSQKDQTASDRSLAIKEHQAQFRERATHVLLAITRTVGQQASPHLLAGCAVLKYGEAANAYSSLVRIQPDGTSIDWYGKTHLVMFGEYIPLIEYLPFFRRWVPEGMGITRGDGAVSMNVNGVALMPNICIETAVERVAPNHIRSLIKRGEPVDAIVNVTNDGWFDRSAVVEHHLRCAQLVAVATRRPVLIAANGGPTAWVDGSGRVVERLRNDEAGTILVTLVKDSRWGLYQSIGDWPARLLAFATIVIGAGGWTRSRRRRVSTNVSNGHLRQ